MRFALLGTSIVPLGVGALLLAACGADDATIAPPVPTVTLKNQSVTPSLLTSLVPGVEIYSLISSDDVIAGFEQAVHGDELRGLA